MPRRKRLFYIIKTSHYILYKGKFIQLIGFGVTDSHKVRVRKYSTSSGTEQEFCRLWYSPKFKVEVLEDIIKERTKSIRHKINGELVEWFSPASGMTIEKLTEMVYEIIGEKSLDLVPIKAQFLPFNDSDWHKELTLKNIQRYPERYLESVEISAENKPIEDT